MIFCFLHFLGVTSQICGVTNNSNLGVTSQPLGVTNNPNLGVTSEPLGVTNNSKSGVTSEPLGVTKKRVGSLVGVTKKNLRRRDLVCYPQIYTEKN